MRISYNNRYIGSTNMTYATEFRFDLVKKGYKRVTWIHFSEDMLPCT